MLNGKKEIAACILNVTFFYCHYNHLKELMLVELVPASPQGKQAQTGLIIL